MRCLARRPEPPGRRVGLATEVVAGDVLDAQRARAALDGDRRRVLLRPFSRRSDGSAAGWAGTTGGGSGSCALLDVVVGEPGLRRGRRDTEQLRAGDAVDFWRVEAYEPDRPLLLSAEMRVAGRAWQ